MSDTEANGPAVHGADPAAVAAALGRILDASHRLRTQKPCWAPSGDNYELCLPLLDGAERLGVLVAVAPVADEATQRRCAWLSTLAAELLVSKSAFGDLLQLARRTRQMDLAAELRWALLPPLTFTTDRVAISGILEPAYQIAGDSFDYGVSGDIAHLAIIDAMGNGLEASRIANLAIAGYRHARRRDAGLPEAFAAIDRVVLEDDATLLLVGLGGDGVDPTLPIAS